MFDSPTSSSLACTTDDAIYWALHLGSGTPSRRAVGLEPRLRDLASIPVEPRNRYRGDEPGERWLGLCRNALVLGAERGWLEFPRAHGAPGSRNRDEIVELLRSRAAWLGPNHPDVRMGLVDRSDADGALFRLTPSGDEEYRTRAELWWRRLDIPLDEIVTSILTAAVRDPTEVAFCTCFFEAAMHSVHDDIRVDAENRALLECSEKGWVDFLWQPACEPDPGSIRRVEASFAASILGSPSHRDPRTFPECQTPATGWLRFFETGRGYSEWRARWDRLVADGPRRPLHLDGVAGMICWEVKACDGGNLRRIMALLEIERPDVPPQELQSALIGQLRRLFEMSFVTLVRHDPSSRQCPGDGACCGPMAREEFDRVLDDPGTWSHGVYPPSHYLDKADDFDVSLWPYLDYDRP